MKWHKRFAIAGITIVFYILSAGPVAWIHPSDNHTTADIVLGWVYKPVALLCEFPPFGHVMGWYMTLWLGVDDDSDDNGPHS